MTSQAGTGGNQEIGPFCYANCDGGGDALATETSLAIFQGWDPLVPPWQREIQEDLLGGLLVSYSKGQTVAHFSSGSGSVKTDLQTGFH